MVTERARWHVVQHWAMPSLGSLTDVRCENLCPGACAGTVLFLIHGTVITGVLSPVFVLTTVEHFPTVVFTPVIFPSDAEQDRSTIRSYGETLRFIRDNTYYVDLDNHLLYRWLAVRLDALGSVLMFLIAILAAAGISRTSLAEIGPDVDDVFDSASHWATHGSSPSTRRRTSLSPQYWPFNLA
ncbi:hypothetical protein DFH06DRAFT_1415867 [Mycena polygramma]|nr:hypothetical protein DFH06DRAFT_1415867 [Mycena polygramma]